MFSLRSRLVQVFFLYAVQLSSAELGGSYHFNFGVTAAIGIPGAFAGLLVVYYCRRKRSQQILLILIGTTTSLSGLFPEGKCSSRSGISVNVIMLR